MSEMAPYTPAIVEFKSHNRNVVTKSQELKKSIDSRADELERMRQELKSQQDAAQQEITKEQWEHWKQEKSRLQSEVESLHVHLNSAQKDYREIMTHLQAHCTHRNQKFICTICDWSCSVIDGDSGYRAF